MSTPVITVVGLGKRYRLSHEVRADTLRDTLMHSARSLARRALGRTLELASEDFWALRNVSFEVRQGEVLGIVGRNGAGKSTLLKILSRITEPTTGSVHLRGRIASLLEVGTGFHPELSGRENIFLNGAILGMTRAEIRRKFDEIVAFAEVDRFLDTPVKYYSSGMYVRLAFAVAAHLEPEILIIDEVLAVGDAAFQKKCLGKMNSVAAQEGRTVLFVSHNMQTIRQLCSRALYLDAGRVGFDGGAAEAAELYFGKNTSIPTGRLRPHGLAGPDSAAVIQELAYRNSRGEPANHLDRSDTLEVELQIEVRRPLARPSIAMALMHVDGGAVFSEVMTPAQFGGALNPGTHALGFRMPACHFKCESYSLTLYLFDGEQAVDQLQGLPLPLIEDAAADPHVEAKRWGVIRVPLTWWGPRKPDNS